MFLTYSYTVVSYWYKVILLPITMTTTKTMKRTTTIALENKETSLNPAGYERSLPSGSEKPWGINITSSLFSKKATVECSIQSTASTRHKWLWVSFQTYLLSLLSPTLRLDHVLWSPLYHRATSKSEGINMHYTIYFFFSINTNTISLFRFAQVKWLQGGDEDLAKDVNACYLRTKWTNPVQTTKPPKVSPKKFISF